MASIHHPSFLLGSGTIGTDFALSVLPSTAGAGEGGPASAGPGEGCGVKANDAERASFLFPPVFNSDFGFLVSSFPLP